MIDYYFELGSATNLATIAVPDSEYATPVVYMRMGSNPMSDWKVFEVIPPHSVKNMLGVVLEMNKADAYLKE